MPQSLLRCAVPTLSGVMLLLGLVAGAGAPAAGAATGTTPINMAPKGS